MLPFEKFSIAGSLASILGLFVSLYVLLKEFLLQEDVTLLKNEEEAWHRNEPRK
jgi:hypothetical protein